MHRSICQKGKITLAISVLLLLSNSSLAQQDARIEYEPAGNGVRLWKSQGGSIIRMLIEESNLGSNEIEMGEITLPPGTLSISHQHGSNEFFYVISGELEHIVEGTSYLLKPGMVGIVRAGDEVVHKVPGSEPVRALIIWTPGGESKRLGKGFTEHPIN